MDELQPTAPPVVSAAPVPDAQRLKIVDALRGVALLGILLMNIPGFAMAQYSSEAYRSDPANVNFWVNNVIGVLFEGKMRALFGMIFGAGVLLFVTKKEKTGRPVTGLFYRRMFWLVLFGLVHAHLVLWVGDILYLYGVCGMIVYLFRNVNPRYLVLGVPIVAVIDFTTGTLIYQHFRDQRIAYLDATRAQAAGQALTDAQQKAIDDWQKTEKDLIPNREIAAENTQKMKGDYAAVASFVRPLAFKLQTVFLVIGIWDSLALMLLGLALYRSGFLTGSWANRAYGKVLVVGYGLGLPLVIYSHYHSFLHNPNHEANLQRMVDVPIEWTGLLYPFQRILLVMAHVAALVLLFKGGYAKGLFRRLEAVGQMAFTNYVMHSVICTLVFFGYGLNQFAEWEYYQLYFLVLGIWVLQLILSPLWLRYFLYGPLEWVWRSLTYWKRQPFRRPTTPPES